jgi:hypothetical protein
VITQDQLAAATIAQIFGSELLNAQKNAKTDSGSTPDFVKVHPRDILMGQPVNQQVQTMEQQRMLEALQREAEASCPLPQQPMMQPMQVAVPPPLQNAVEPQPTIQPTKTTSLLEVQQPSSSNNVWERIALSLEKIATRLETVEITLKKKRVRRK